MLNEFAQPTLVAQLTRQIRDQVRRPLRLMEICGTHTMAISRYSLRPLLTGIDLVSGPGCPVCVTASADIDRMIALARRPEVIITTFGDMLRVPGSESSLSQEKTRGADVRVVYSPFDALAVAAENPNQTVVFLGIGFETTVPVVAAAVDAARRQGIPNFLVYSAHKTLPAALRFLLADEVDLDGLLLPGHVLAVGGRREYDFLAAAGVPAVVAGFAPLDILQAVHRLVDMVNTGRPAVENAYTRVVREDGNPTARAMLERCFTPVDATWRGIGVIPGSGLELAPDYAAFDARPLCPPIPTPAVEDPGCLCGSVIRGRIKPFACPRFARECTPTRPVGPCMVSSEGACAAYYRYEQHGGKAGETDVRSS